MTNPLTTAKIAAAALYPWQEPGSPVEYDRTAQDAADIQAGAIWKAAEKSNNPTGIRLAVVTIKAAKAHNDSYSADPLGNWGMSYKLDCTEAAATITDDPFEARLIGLALDGWWNDAIDAAWSALGVEPPENAEDGSTDAWDAAINALLVPIVAPVLVDPDPHGAMPHYDPKARELPLSGAKDRKG